MKFLLFIGLTIFAAASTARVVREAPAVEHELPLDNFLEKFEKGLAQLEKLALNAAGAENTEELKQRASEHIDILTKQFSEFTDNIKEETERLKESDVGKDLRHTVDTHVANFKEHADKHIAEFKQDHPETYNQISTHIDTLKSASSAIANKIEGLAQSEEAKHLKEASLKFLEDVKESFLSFAKDLKDDKKE